MLVDQGTQCDSSAASLKEQLQQEVNLARKAFLLPDHESDPDSDSAWESMSETEDMDI